MRNPVTVSDFQRRLSACTAKIRNCHRISLALLALLCMGAAKGPAAVDAARLRNA